MVLGHLKEISAVANVPVNADFEGGYADAPEDVAESVRLCCETGVSGLSIEDYTGKKDTPLYDFDLAVARMKAARAAIDKAGGGVLLTGRSEGFIRNRPDLDETIKRLKAYADAGADVLYSPGISTREQISAVVKAVAPKPVNLLIGGPSDLTVSDVTGLGVRRISVGGALARAAWGGSLRTAKQIAEQGSFKGFADAAPGRRDHEGPDALSERGPAMAPPSRSWRRPSTVAMTAWIGWRAWRLDRRRSPQMRPGGRLIPGR